MVNCFKHLQVYTFIPKSKKKINTQFSVQKCPNTSILYTTDTHFTFLQQKLDLFLFSHLLTCKNSTIYWDVMLLALILHLSFLKFFSFFKLTMPSQKAVLIRLKIRKISFTAIVINSYSFSIAIKITVF